MNIGALPRRCRPQVIRIGTTVRFILKAPYLGGLIGARPYLGSSACQAQGSQKLWTMRIWHCYGMILRYCKIAGSWYLWAVLMTSFITILLITLLTPKWYWWPEAVFNCRTSTTFQIWAVFDFRHKTVVVFGGAYISHIILVFSKNVGPQYRRMIIGRLSQNWFPIRRLMEAKNKPWTFD